MGSRAQGAIELNDASFNCRHLAGQGAIVKPSVRLASPTSYPSAPHLNTASAGTLLAQGATRSAHSSPTYCPLVGQGATEYLVLLAVVLIVALVSVALLGFFPGMASDAQITQSQAYWQSAQPVAITEWAAKAYAANGGNYPYFRVRNSGAYPIRITGIVGADGAQATAFYSDSRCGIPSDGYYNISDYFYLAPGEEKYFAELSAYGLACNRNIRITASGSGGRYVGGATSLCANSTASPGTVTLPSMGFEYIEYIDGQQITKKQAGRQVAIRCGPPF